eukprot:958648-Pleurochrysis_carterae.AAC.2
MQPRAPAVSMEVETPVLAAVHPDAQAVVAEVGLPVPAAVQPDAPALAAEMDTAAHPPLWPRRWRRPLTTKSILTVQLTPAWT